MNNKDKKFDDISAKDFAKICIAAVIIFGCIVAFLAGANMADRAVTQGESETGLLIIDASGIVGTISVLYLKNKLGR